VELTGHEKWGIAVYESVKWIRGTLLTVDLYLAGEGLKPLFELPFLGINFSMLFF